MSVDPEIFFEKIAAAIHVVHGCRLQEQNLLTCVVSRQLMQWWIIIHAYMYVPDANVQVYPTLHLTPD
jgi:hypothetical protein